MIFCYRTVFSHYIVMFKLRSLNRLVQSLEFPPVQSLSILQTLPKAATGDTYKEQINSVIQQYNCIAGNRSYTVCTGKYLHQFYFHHFHPFISRQFKPQAAVITTAFSKGGAYQDKSISKIISL